MAQAKERSASIDSQIHFQIQAPEAATPQVLVKEPVLEEAESPIISKKLRKLFDKVKFNAKITEEVKYIGSMKADLDAKMYRNNMPYY